MSDFGYRLTIPLLGKSHFQFLMEIKLNGDLKSKLKEYKINDNLLPSKTIFNYHNFIKYFGTRKIISSTVKWTNNIIRTLKLDLFNDIDLKTDLIGLLD
ncbi:hypothetical protein C1646_749795 [Rhizophagus diaphanus]|nr:hypothetical protein C1646_749795 [Rhizophagus diaphanus] [Rhizophagus sp. MUCL 43196]